MNGCSSAFLNDGREEIKRTEQSAVARGRIVAEIYAKYSKDLSHSNILRRLFVRLKMRREIHRRLEEIAPVKGLYLMPFNRSSN